MSEPESTREVVPFPDKTKRQSISVRTRFEVFKRDNFTCQYCSRKPPTVILELDHILAIANGGTNHRDNLVTSCWDCNHGKGAVPLDSVSEPLADLMQRRQEASKQLRAYNRFVLAEKRREDEEILRLGEHWHRDFTNGYGKREFDSERESSVRTFLRRLSFAEVLDSIDIAVSQKRVYTSDYMRWKYFCGICWRRIREREGKRGK